MTAVTASAPGKVLITGGYLVLEPAFTGLVLTVSARFRTRVFSSPIPQWAESLVSQSNMAVYVHTPQVSATPSRYEYLPDTASLQQTYTQFIGVSFLISLLTVCAAVMDRPTSLSN
jgi:phosphomevalonate kinase